MSRRLRRAELAQPFRASERNHSPLRSPTLQPAIAAQGGASDISDAGISAAQAAEDRPDDFDVRNWHNSSAPAKEIIRSDDGQGFRCR